MRRQRERHKTGTTGDNSIHPTRQCMLLENITPEWTLESREAKAALRYFGHVVREERGMENDVTLGENEREYKVRKTKNKMARQSNKLRKTFMIHIIS